MGVVSVRAVAAACVPGSTPSGAALATATAAAVVSSLPSCVVVPELTEGLYYVNEKLDRSDIRADSSNGSVSEGGIYRQSHGLTLLDVAPDGEGSKATFEVAIQTA